MRTARPRAPCRRKWNHWRKSACESARRSTCRFAASRVGARRRWRRRRTRRRCAGGTGRRDCHLRAVAVALRADRRAVRRMESARGMWLASGSAMRRNAIFACARRRCFAAARATGDARSCTTNRTPSGAARSTATGRSLGRRAALSLVATAPAEEARAAAPFADARRREPHARRRSSSRSSCGSPSSSWSRSSGPGSPQPRTAPRIDLRSTRLPRAGTSEPWRPPLPVYFVAAALGIGVVLLVLH